MGKGIKDLFLNAGLSVSPAQQRLAGTREVSGVSGPVIFFFSLFLSIMRPSLTHLTDSSSSSSFVGRH